MEAITHPALKTWYIRYFTVGSLAHEASLVNDFLRDFPKILRRGGRMLAKGGNPIYDVYK